MSWDGVRNNQHCAAYFHPVYLALWRPLVPLKSVFNNNKTASPIKTWEAVIAAALVWAMYGSLRGKRGFRFLWSIINVFSTVFKCLYLKLGKK